MIDLTEKAGALTFSARVIPKSSRSEIVGCYDGCLKIKLNAPPTGGAANAELIKVLAKRLRISQSAVEIVGGQTSKQKRVRVSGIGAADFLDFIGG